MRSSTRNSSAAFARTFRRDSTLGKDTYSSDDWVDDFQLITYDDLPIQLDNSLGHPQINTDASALDETSNADHPTPNITPTTTSSLRSPKSSHSELSATPSHHPLAVPHPSQPHSVFPGLSRISLRRSLRRSSRVSRFSSRSTKREAEGTDLVLDFPQPPTHIPTPVASAHGAFVEPIVAATTVEDTAPFFSDPDPFRSESILCKATPAPESGSENTYRSFSTPRVITPPSPTPSTTKTIKGSAFPNPIRHIKSFTKAAFRTSFRAPISAVLSTYSARAKRTRHTRHSPPTLDTVPPLFVLPTNIDPQSPPEFPFNSIDLIPPDSVTAADQALIECPSHTITYERVDPLALTASPSPFLGSDLLSSSVRTSFVPPSPSWLSRNVQGFESLNFHAHFGPPEITPVVDPEAHFSPSPASLPIPPRLLISPYLSESPLPSPPLSPLEVWLTRPDSLKSRRSSSSTSSTRTLSRNSSTTSTSKHSTRTRHSAQATSGKENKPVSDSLPKVSHANVSCLLII